MSRVCWLLNCESGESLLRGYKQLATALGIVVKGDEGGAAAGGAATAGGKGGESEAQLISRLQQEITDKLQQCSSALLIFDNATSLAALHPFLPLPAAGPRCRCILTSLNGSIPLSRRQKAIQRGSLSSHWSTSSTVCLSQCRLQRTRSQ